MYEVIINGLLSNSPSVSLSSFEGLLFLLRSKHRQCVIPIIPNISSAIVCRLEDFQDMYVICLFNFQWEYSYTLYDEFLLLFDKPTKLN